MAPPARAGSEAHPPIRFLGVQSCSSTSCHGGAADNRDQVLTWSRQDAHARAYATLTTPRSARMAQALGVADPTRDLRCTSCHAPFHAVPADRLAESVDLTKGVSCENCHGPAESWLRSHTRPDFTHQDRLADGLRDLKNLRARANACVACHQTLEPALLAAGHPELIFELDGQAVAQPKHWRERAGWHGPQAWLVGQAVALREMSWQLARMDTPDAKAVERWQGLVWLLRVVSGADAGFDGFKAATDEATRENFRNVQQLADDLSRRAADLDWSAQRTRAGLRALSATAAEFRDATTPPPVQGRRAERLVLGLERLFLGLPQEPARKEADAALSQLFRQVQSLPAFDPAEFARRLDEFNRHLPVE